MRTIKFNFSDKILKNPIDILSKIPDGSNILVGGFGLCGIPENSIRYLRKLGTKNLMVISNDAGNIRFGLGLLVQNKQIRKLISSYIGENRECQLQYLNGELELELVPQGTLAEKIRQGGAGIPAFYTATGAGTQVEQGGFPIKYKFGGKQVEIESLRKEVREFNGRKYVLEESIFGDYALIKAWKADTKGNLVFNKVNIQSMDSFQFLFQKYQKPKTARNFNQDMVTAAKCTIVEVEEIVEAGQLDPDQIHTPSVYVNHIYKGDVFEKRFEKIVYNKQFQNLSVQKNIEIRHKIINRAAQEVKNGMYVNLGIGIPTLLPSFLPSNIQIEFQSENGVLGYGDYPSPGQEDSDLINAGKETVTLNNGSSIFSSSQSFGIIRGGHLDLSILGALQVSKHGDLASWIIPGHSIKGMGGAMDLVSCGSKVVVVMQHESKGQQKLLEKCTYPITGEKVVNMVITEKAVFELSDEQLVLTEIAYESSLDEIRSKTGFDFQISNNLKSF